MRATILRWVWSLALLCAGLSGARWLAEHPQVFGPFGLMIGMGPLAIYFEFPWTIPVVPGVGMSVGLLAVALTPLFGCARLPEPRPFWLLWLIAGAILVTLSFGCAVAATARYNVGLAGPIPDGWFDIVLPSSGFAITGAITMAVSRLGRWYDARLPTAVYSASS